MINDSNELSPDITLLVTFFTASGKPVYPTNGGLTGSKQGQVIVSVGKIDAGKSTYFIADLDSGFEPASTWTCVIITPDNVAP